MHIAYLHGLNSSDKSFAYLVDRLPEHTSTLVNYNSHQPLLKSIKQVLRQLPKDVPITLVGHSLGGVIAALIAHEQLAQVTKLATISSPIGGSKAALVARWLPSAPDVLSDITPGSAYMVRLRQSQLSIPLLSIISTAGHLALSPERNDSIVTVSSQRALPGAKKIEVKANHFEVLMAEETVHHLSSFIWN